jgi:hypothetical protein
MSNHRVINRLLGESGLAQLTDPGLPSQLAALVRDECHFKSLMLACEPEHRAAMYEAMAPNLHFRPRQLHEYLIEAQREAEARQLPTIDAEGKLHEFRPAELKTVQNIVEGALLEQHLIVTCRKCTVQATFYGARKCDAVAAARAAGWCYDATGPEPFEVCPDCPASRNAA